MKKFIIDYLAKFFYPQNIFGKEILKKIRNLENITIIDAPCGNGETSYHLSKNQKNRVLGYDLSSVSIKSADAIFKRKNLSFKKADIFEVFNFHEKVDVFCLINSIFLLPQPKKIIQNLSQLIKNKGKLFVIIPNINGKNFKKFKAKNTNYNNLNLTKDEFLKFVCENGFKLTGCKGICYVSSYYRFEGRFLSILIHPYLTFLSKVVEIFKIESPNYYLLEFDVSK